ncbi:hypothetical protein GCM10008967_37500 [Bacillus carboniphilus]|uniref:Group-specific protein n=1 Tax=Bacillus carboniphilus TaxID=86663 RepID=A0ABN0WPK9_9BACI
MILSGLLVVCLIIIIIFTLVFKKFLERKSLIEMLVFSILLVLSGGVFLFEPHLDNEFLVIPYAIILIGFLTGVFSFFFKKN